MPIELLLYPLLVLLFLSLVLQLKLAALLERAANHAVLSEPAGELVARLIHTQKLEGIGLELDPDGFGDYFDATRKVIVLSPTTHAGRSLRDLSVVVHEVGHAEQFSRNCIFHRIGRAIEPFELGSVVLFWLLCFYAFWSGLEWAAGGAAALLVLNLLFQAIYLRIESSANSRSSPLLARAPQLSAAEHDLLQQTRLFSLLTYLFPVGIDALPSGVRFFRRALGK
jgi:Zn-dependent membrane protease YugP